MGFPWHDVTAVYLGDKQVWPEPNKPLPADDNWMRVGPNTDAAIWRPWGRETGEL